MRPRLKMRLGDLLVHENIITSEQLDNALSAQRSSGRKLGDTLIDLGFICEPQLLRFLAQQLTQAFHGTPTMVPGSWEACWGGLLGRPAAGTGTIQRFEPV